MTNKPGRPPLDPASPSVSVSVHMPANLFDKAYIEACRERVTLPEWIRRTIRQATKDGAREPL